jgi:hypothetical protein
MATNVPLAMIILCGTFVIAVAIVMFVVPPEWNGICIARSFGFHCGVNLVYAPLFLKNILTYRIFNAGAQKIAFKSLGFQMMFTCICFMIQV